MFVRGKVVKGRTYYLIVEGVREGPRVRQRIVLSLGREPNPRVVLRRWKRRLGRLREQQESDRFEAGLEAHSLCRRGKPKARKLEKTNSRIAKLEPRVEMLAGLIKARKIGTTPKWKDG
jgi:hypothetical protein